MRFLILLMFLGATAAPAGPARASGNFYTRIRANDAPVGGRVTIFAYFLDSLDVAVAPPPGEAGRPLLLLFRDSSGPETFLVPGDLALEDARGRRLTEGLGPVAGQRIHGRIDKGETRAALWWVPAEREAWHAEAPPEIRLFYGFHERSFVPLDDKDLAGILPLVPWDALRATVPDPRRPAATVTWIPDPAAFDEPPEIKEFVAPIYPETARKFDFRGVVRVVARVDETGRVVDAFVLQSEAIHELNISALVAVSQWTFRAGRKSGRKVAGDIVVPIQFTDAEQQ